jgi:sec-independent protein translocase protein TatC
MGLLVALPYIIYSLFGFISPALYDHERRHSRHYVVGGYVMFLVGCALNYLVIFPFTFRFLAGYQVSSAVPNMISLESYTSTLLGMTLVMGALFEIPIVCALLARLGVLHHQQMVRSRRYAIVIALVVAALITPTGDPFTLMLVAVPIWMLYELGAWVVRGVEKSRNK